MVLLKLKAREEQGKEENKVHLVTCNHHKVMCDSTMKSAKQDLVSRIPSKEGSMIDKQTIHQAASLLMQADVQKIILFGSYARDDANEESDVDLMVVEKHVHSKVKEIARLRKLLRPLRLPIDVMVVSEQEVKDWGALPGTALYWAIKEGEVLYETKH